MTAADRRELDRFITFVSRKVAQIERNVKIHLGVKEFARRQAQVARATAKKRATKRGRS